jgi:hypothetical protein
VEELPVPLTMTDAGLSPLWRGMISSLGVTRYLRWAELNVAITIIEDRTMIVLIYLTPEST